MKYSIEEVPVKKLIELIENNKVDLKPSYQRNFIWNPTDQKYLIDSILRNYPLPNFFLYLKADGSYEMVDGQQRSRTIFRFWEGIIASSEKLTINDIDHSKFLEYKLNWSIITLLEEGDSLENFYVLVNKRGKHLNTPELFTAAYHDKHFLLLVEDLLDLQDMIELDLFSETSSKRMNDRSFIEELVAYLKVGITDKKDVVEKIYENDIEEKEIEFLKARFAKIISIIKEVSSIKPINTTRFKQKNDFYTLFNFVNENIEAGIALLKYQYKILLFIEEFIKPSNEECVPFREYALNCVSQSNSKNARIKRLEFFNAILKNTNIEHNEDLQEVLTFLEANTDKVAELVKYDGFQLLKV